jgi:large subunit ribosomal protein L28
MAKVCENCGKKTMFGNTISRRGLAKYLGGVGVKKTGVSRRRFEPNLQLLRVEIEGTVRRAKICTRCLKSGTITKPRRREIPDNVRAAMKAHEEAKLPENRKKARQTRKQARLEAAKAKAAAPKKPKKS